MWSHSKIRGGFYFFPPPDALLEKLNDGCTQLAEDSVDFTVEDHTEHKREATKEILSMAS